MGNRFLKESRRIINVKDSLHWLLLCALVYIPSNFAIADDLRVKKIINDMKNFATSNKVAPDDRDIKPFIQPHENELSSDELTQIDMAWRNLQKPVISKQALAKLFEGKRLSLQSLRMEYEIITRPYNDSSTVSDSRRIVRTIIDKDKVYYDSTFKDNSKLDDQLLRQRIRAYNGKYVSTVKKFRDDSRLIEGGILPFDGVEGLFPDECPLHYACLLSQNFLDKTDKEFLPFDLALSGTDDQGGIVFQKTYSIGGIDCIQVYFNSVRFYLDPSKDFSIVRIEKYCFKRDPIDGSEKLLPFRIFSMSDHLDCGNGIWIPQALHLTLDLGTKYDRKTAVRVLGVEVNKKIDPKVFTDIFPENAVVSDIVHNVVYTWSDRPSIDATLDSVIQPKRVSILRWISASVGVALIVTALGIMKYREMRRRKAA